MPRIQQVVIVGGGTAGWIAAAVLSRLLGRVIGITLVESEALGTIGVGEATIPPIVSLNNALKLNEAEFLRETQGTIKLGIQFEGWGGAGQAYMHAFGGIGKGYPFCSFHHLWRRYRQQQPGSSYWDYSLNYQAAIQGKYAPVARLGKTDMPGLVHAYHFDAALYAALLRRLSEAAGVRRVEGLVEEVTQHSETGHIQALKLQGGREVPGDLFIDCTGFRGLLIAQTLGVGYESWQHWLPCSKAVVAQSETTEPPRPYTRAIAHEAGWRWRIPLQHRVGNGLVYSDAQMTDEQASERLLQALDGKPATEPRVISFATGRRKRQWQGNCVALGLASGFLEPLESTSIHLIQTGALRLVRLFPHTGICQPDLDEYNRQSQEEFEHIRDFLIMHYKLNARPEPFWRQCAAMPIPAGLAHKIEMFRQSGKVHNPSDALFADIAWQQVLLGQGALPADHHPLALAMPAPELARLMQRLRELIAETLAPLPPHHHWLATAAYQPPNS